MAIQGNPGTARNGERKVQFVRANMMRSADDSQASSSVNNDQAYSATAAPEPPWGHGPEHVQVQPPTGWTTYTWGDGSDHIEGPEPEPECWGHARRSSSDGSPTFYDDAYVNGQRTTSIAPTPIEPIVFSTTSAAPNRVPSDGRTPCFGEDVSSAPPFSHEASMNQARDIRAQAREKLRQPNGMKEALELSGRDFNAYHSARVAHDDATNVIIQSLMAQRKTIEKELMAIIHEERPDGTQLGPHPHATPEYLSLMAQVEELNTAMVESVLEAKEISARQRPTRATDANESSSIDRDEITVPDQ